MTAPCLNCPDRKVGCKIDCDRYADFRKQLDERKQAMDKERNKNKLINDFKVDTIRKSKKKR